MKAAVTDGKGNVWIEEIPLPEIGPYQCLCKILASATCSGTDKKIINGEFPYPLNYPGILGHESVGVVVKTGKKVRYIKEGDIFLRPTSIYPGEKLGKYFSLWGCFAEYGIVTDIEAFYKDNPDKTLNNFTIFQQKIPSEIKISPADATMLITLKETYSFISKIGVRMNSKVAILGTGPVGMSFCFFSKLLGAYPVIVIGRREEPLEYIKKVGADFVINNKKENMVKKVKEITNNRGVDFVIDAAGDEKLFTESAGLLTNNGRIVPYATPYSTEYIADRKKGPRNWEIIFTGPDENLAHNSVIGLVKLNVIPFKMFYSHTMKFEKIKDGFDLLKNKSAYKIVFEM
ncbi:zinc-binding dehydrogenase [bacterium]|nr:zinc-binding dehydrogenase [bacterium]